MLALYPVVAGCCLLSSVTFKPIDATHGQVLLDSDPILDVAAGGDGAITPHLAWEDGALVLAARLPDTGSGRGVHLTATHHVKDTRHVWVPHLAPTPAHVMGDHAFRSPAIVLANSEVALVLVPDLEDVGRNFTAKVRTWLDYDHPSRTVTLAASNYTVSGHVLYERTDLAYGGQRVRLRLHVVTSGTVEDRENPYGLAARWLWNRWGRPRHEAGGSQKAPIETYAQYICRWAFSLAAWGETVWQEFDLNGRRCGAPAFIVDVQQHHAGTAEPWGVHGHRP